MSTSNGITTSTSTKHFLQAMAMNMAYQRDMGFGGVQFTSTDIPPPPPIMSPILMRSMSSDSMGCSSPSMRHKSALTIACPGPVRERTLSDVNSLAFQVNTAPTFRKINYVHLTFIFEYIITHIFTPYHTTSATDGRGMSGF